MKPRFRDDATRRDVVDSFCESDHDFLLGFGITTGVFIRELEVEVETRRQQKGVIQKGLL